MLQKPLPTQDAVRAALGGTLIGVAIVFVYVLFQATQVYDLEEPRAMDQAQVARNLSRGEGFSTKLIRPLSLARVPQLSRHPDLANAPLHPLVMSLLFRALGPSARVASWTSGLAFLLTVPLVLWLGTHTFTRKVGMLAALATATSLGLLTVGSTGTDVALLTFLFTLLAIVLVCLRESETRRMPLTAAAGALTALLYLTNYVYILVALPVGVLVGASLPARRRIPGVVTFGLALVAVCSPWWTRNLLLTGDPFFTVTASETVMGTRTHSGNTLYRTFDPKPPGLAAFLFNNPRELYEKAHDAAVGLEPAFFTVAGVIMTPFFLVAVLIPLGHEGLDRLRLMLYVAMVFLAVGVLALLRDFTPLLAVTPVIMVVAAAFFYQLLDLRLRGLSEKHKARWTNLAVTLLLLLHAAPVVLALAPGRTADTAR
jgi:4-amino-4-deoxy-L-arabinose transferase-like glycosyltransferase